MRKLTTTVISTVCLVAGAGSATLYAQATAPVYTVYEANITDEAAYSKALFPDMSVTRRFADYARTPFKVSDVPFAEVVRPSDRLRRQLVQQCFGLFQIACVETLSEPPVHRRHQFARLPYLALVAP